MTTTLLMGDCLERLAEVESGSIGHIVTDPPYGQTNESYESGIAFDPRLWRECYRVTGPNAALISFAGSPTYHKIATAIEAGGWKVRQMWGWVYRDGMITSAYPKEGFDRLAPAMDPIVFATKGKVLLNLEREGDGEWRRGKRSCGLSLRSDGNTASERARGHWPKSIASDGVVPFEYFDYRRAQPDLIRTGHPNQKPLALLRWIVAKLPKPGPILDPFTGSATTLEAAMCEGFDSVGIERDPGYHALAEKRLAVVRDATPLLRA